MLAGGTTMVFPLPNPPVWPELCPGEPRCSAATHLHRCSAMGCPSPQRKSRSHVSCFPLRACSSLPQGARVLSFAWIVFYLLPPLINCVWVGRTSPLRLSECWRPLLHWCLKASAHKKPLTAVSLAQLINQPHSEAAVRCVSIP